MTWCGLRRLVLLENKGCNAGQQLGLWDALEEDDVLGVLQRASATTLLTAAL